MGGETADIIPLWREILYNIGVMKKVFIIILCLGGSAVVWFLSGKILSTGIHDAWTMPVIRTVIGVVFGVGFVIYALIFRKREKTMSSKKQK